MRLYLDDVRFPDQPDLQLVRTAKEAIKLINTGKVEFISLDHDLGTSVTGYDVACYIELLVASGIIRCPAYRIHSANPVGAERMAKAMESAKRFCKGY